MSRRKRKGRNINGLLLVDKPADKSSNQVLQEVKHLYQAAKAGHTGTLDPIATGLLIVCFGQATKVSQHLLNASKAYRVTCHLGATTETGDREGEVIRREQVTEQHRSRIETVLQQMLGEQDQMPPMYSAVKINGVPLYKLAREGKTVERKSRRIHIYSIQQVHLEGDMLTLDVSCSKGTYVRTLVEDLGEALGCGAYVYQLRRLQVGQFDVSHAHTVDSLYEQVEQNSISSLDKLLNPIERALLDYPEMQLSAGLIEIARQGKKLKLESPPLAEYLRVYDRNGIFCGLGEVLENGRMALRTFSSAGARSS